ncbi:MAG TPA: acylneuraminate cytidylyltransferase family protein [Candidatus Sumerlaeota bacterium]|nr:acylneuraminate cytidylyltransferase family protein [Candidatus Sumerlaeota bacterium]
MKFAALIPIKDHSERVPGKNFREIAGRPLWQHIVATLSSMDEIPAIYIDTDSQRFTSEVLAPYPKVRIIERPERLRGDFVPTNHLFAHDLTLIPETFTHFLQTHTTNPLLTAATIRAAMKALDGGRAAHDSLFTVTPYFARFFRRDGSAINHDPRELKRTQDLDPVLEENSNLYLFTRESFARTASRIGERPLMFEMDRLEATDIDDPATWQLAETLLLNRPSLQ